MLKIGIFAEALKEVKASLLKVFLFEEMLNAILVFLVAYLIGSLFKISVAVPLLLSIGYGAFSLYRELHLKPARMVETKYKDLKEKLSTAAEYAKVENRVVNELKAEVLQNLKKVEESSFLNEKRVYTKSVAAVVLCFVILLLSPFSISLFKHSFPNLFSAQDNSDAAAIAGFKLGKEKAKGEAPLALQQSNKGIYGSPTAAKLGSEELKVILKPAGTELSTSNVKPPQELQFTEQYPEEVVSVAAESMEERIPKEQQELVRRYFNNVVEANR
ncbi:hypothetical protein HYY73_00255 [Candidatus Woesearchaeota archaeon]|nr:hypothetical protein [Candidatus Woesearchaeota archaeon]